MQLARIVLEWSGSAVVGRAVTVLHYAYENNQGPNSASLLAALRNMRLYIPQGVTITVPNSGDVIEDTTGDLTGVWTGSGGGAFAGDTAPNAAAGVGACIGWTTGGIVNGAKGPRKLRGRTFIVPLSTNAYEADGTLIADAVTTITGVAAGIAGAGPLAVWHRPTTAGGSDGNSYGVVSWKVRDKVAFLSSRRD